MNSQEKLAKLTGIILICFGSLLFFWSSASLVNSFLWMQIALPFVLSLLLVAFISIGFLALGFKLLRFNSIRPIEISEIKNRAKQQSKPKSIFHPIAISLSGIDGCGKSTQLELITKRFELRKIPYKYVRLRWACFVSYVPLALFQLLGLTEKKLNPRDKKLYEVYHMHKNFALAKIWPYFFTFDLLISSLTKVSIPKLRGFFVLCDRSEVDALVDLIADTKNPSLAQSFIGKILISFSRKNRASFLVDIDANTAFERKKDILYIDYVKARRQLYLDLSNTAQLTVLNGNGTAEDIHEQWVNQFFSHYPFWYLN